MRIGVFYDMLVSRGGAEKAAIELATHLNADLITSGFNRDLPEYRNLSVNIIDIGNTTYKFSKTIAYLLEVPLRFFFMRGFFQYDIYIFTGASSIFGSKRGNNNIWYCHSPNRGLYDQYHKHRKNMNRVYSLFFGYYVSIFRNFDQLIVSNNIKEIIANSRNASKRILKYYGRISTVIYPAINTHAFRFKRIGDYYLAVSRLFPLKRMDLIARTFTQIPSERLILVGNGPQRSEIESIISHSPNISLKTNVDDRELIELYANCKAVIFIPEAEDFGFIPLEAMASGKVCIASNEGGCKETIVNGKTGFLIQATSPNLLKIINGINIKTLITMRHACENHVKKFDLDIFSNKWRAILEKYL